MNLQERLIKKFDHEGIEYSFLNNGDVTTFINGFKVRIAKTTGQAVHVRNCSFANFKSVKQFNAFYNASK